MSLATYTVVCCYANSISPSCCASLATHRVLQHSSRRGGRAPGRAQRSRTLGARLLPEGVCPRIIGEGMNDSGLRWHTPPTCVHCFNTNLCSSCVNLCVLLLTPQPAVVCTMYCFYTNWYFRAGRWEREGGLMCVHCNICRTHQMHAPVVTVQLQVSL